MDYTGDTLTALSDLSSTVRKHRLFGKRIKRQMKWLRRTLAKDILAAMRAGNPIIPPIHGRFTLKIITSVDEGFDIDYFYDAVLGSISVGDINVY